MCMILNKERPLNLVAVSDFYYRRIKRIVPLYMSVVFCVLLLALRELSPFDFKQLVEEAAPALCFYSNMLSSRETDYFDLVS